MFIARNKISSKAVQIRGYFPCVQFLAVLWQSYLILMQRTAGLIMHSTKKIKQRLQKWSVWGLTCHTRQHLTVIRVNWHNLCTLIRDTSHSLSSLSCDSTTGFVLLSRIFSLQLNLFTDSWGFNCDDLWWSVQKYCLMKTI